jgi:hypothetical protein
MIVAVTGIGRHLFLESEFFGVWLMMSCLGSTWGGSGEQRSPFNGVWQSAGVAKARKRNHWAAKRLRTGDVKVCIDSLLEFLVLGYSSPGKEDGWWDGNW